MRGQSDQNSLRERAEGLLKRADDVGAIEPEEPEEPSGGSIWERVERVAGIAPVQGDPSLEPADNPWELAMMAGWGDVDERSSGHDAMFGVDRMTTGEVDATQELVVESGTPGTPLALGPRETIDNTVNHSEELSYEDPCGGDWCAYL